MPHQGKTIHAVGSTPQPNIFSPAYGPSTNVCRIYGKNQRFTFRQKKHITPFQFAESVDMAELQNVAAMVNEVAYVTLSHKLHQIRIANQEGIVLNV